MKELLYGVVALLGVGASTAAAQVGHQPTRSPYADLEYKQEITPLGGWVRARTDPAGVAPRSAPMIGLRYELRLVGPLSLSSDITSTFAERAVVDPFKPAATRRSGTLISSPVHSADIALAMNLTGRKSWHHLVPQVRGGVGVLRSAARDSSGFSFGTPFAFSVGGGLKFAPGGRWMLRGDLTDRIFRLAYPDAFYRPTSDNTTVVSTQTAKSFYTHHTALTVGVSYLFHR